jgi:hypothetical protein
MWLMGGSGTPAQADAPSAAGNDMSTVGNGTTPTCISAKLAAAASVGATSVTVDSATGMTGGDDIVIDTGGIQETRTIDHLAGNTVFLQVALSNAHGAGVPALVDCTPIVVGFDMNTAGNYCGSTTLSAAASIGDTFITVVTGAVLSAGQTIVIDTGANQETATIDTVVSNTVNLTAGLTKNHLLGAWAQVPGDCTLGTIDTCVHVPTAGADITFDTFLNGLPVVQNQASDFMLFGYTIWEKTDQQPVGTITSFIHEPVPAGPSPINLIDQVSPFAGLYESSTAAPTALVGWSAGAVDVNGGGLEPNPPFTKGVISRISATIPSGTLDGLYYLTILDPIIGDGSSNNYCAPASANYVGCTMWDGTTTNPNPYGIIAKGDAVFCPKYADVGVTQVVKASDCSGDPPTTMAINTDVTLCLVKTITNNGPEDGVSGTIDVGLTETDDCDITPDPLNDDTFSALDSGDHVDVPEKFTINCADPSTHVFTFDNEVQPTLPAGVEDTNQDNNIVSTEFSIDVTAAADVEIDSQAFVSPPTDITVGVDTTVTLRKHLNIVSGYGPVDVTVTTDVPSPPANCTATLDDQDPGNPVTLPLPLGTDVIVDEDWIINCGTEGAKTLTFENAIAIDTPHVTDPGPGLNTLNTNLNVNVAKLLGDVNCNGVWDIIDAGFIFQYVLGLRTGSNLCPLPANTLYLPAADVSGSGAIGDVIDAGFIFRCLLGYHNAFCPAGP